MDYLRMMDWPERLRWAREVLLESVRNTLVMFACIFAFCTLVLLSVLLSIWITSNIEEFFANNMVLCTVIMMLMVSAVAGVAVTVRQRRARWPTR